MASLLSAVRKEKEKRAVEEPQNTDESVEDLAIAAAFHQIEDDEDDEEEQEEQEEEEDDGAPGVEPEGPEPGEGEGAGAAAAAPQSEGFAAVPAEHAAGWKVQSHSDGSIASASAVQVVHGEDADVSEEEEEEEEKVPLERQPSQQEEIDFAMASRCDRQRLEREASDREMAARIQAEVDAEEEEATRLERERREKESLRVAQRLQAEEEAEARRIELMRAQADKDAAVARRLAQGDAPRAAMGEADDGVERKRRGVSRTPSDLELAQMLAAKEEQAVLERRRQEAEDARLALEMSRGLSLEEKRRRQEARDARLAAKMAQRETEKMLHPAQRKHHSDPYAPGRCQPLPVEQAVEVERQKRQNKHASPQHRQQQQQQQGQGRVIDESQPLQGQDLYEVELFDEPPEVDDVHPGMLERSPSQKFANMHKALQQIIAEEKALLEAANGEPRQEAAILEEYFPQKMFVLMQLPMAEQKQYHMVGPKLSKEAQKKYKKLMKEEEKRLKKAEKEAKKRQEKLAKERKKAEKEARKKGIPYRPPPGEGMPQQQQHRPQQHARMVYPAGAAPPLAAAGPEGEGVEGADADFLLAKRLQEELNRQ